MPVLPQFTAAALMSVIGAAVSALRGKPVRPDEPPGDQPGRGQVTPEISSAGELNGVVRENARESVAD